ncbi:MAG: LexA family transcriptional regulator [Subdoligranulum sp.]|nr:LexA family transcriptional regulator [Subdoligranulum sp.]
MNQLRDLRHLKGVSMREVAKSLGIPYTTYVNYEKQTREPNSEMLIALAKYFGVTVDYLIGNSKTVFSRNGFGTSYAERETIKKYRALDDHGKDMVDTVLAKEYARCTALQDVGNTTENYIWLPLSEQAASAGTGVDLGPEAFEQIQVSDNEKTRRAGFAVGIRGDSMEPLFYDGDIVLVSKEQPESGDIALVTLDGRGYVKRLGKGVLISENERYDPIPMNESIIVNGRVLGVLDPDWIQEQD